MEKNILKRVASLALALVMVLSVLVVVDPKEVSAAGVTKNGTGKWSVTISDDQCYGGAGYDAYGNYISYGTGQVYWIKFKAKADGYVRFTASPATSLDSFSDGKWGLYDNKKKLLSCEDTFTTLKDDYKQTYYGIKKNKTYYFGVKAYVGTKINASFTKVNEKSGSKKSKAKTIARNQKVQGVITANSKETDWYKFKLSKKQYVNLSFAAKTNGVLKFTIYQGGRSIGTVKQNYESSESYSDYIRNAYTKAKLKIPKGTTYYIKVEREGTGSSGGYTLKWK